MLNNLEKKRTTFKDTKLYYKQHFISSYKLTPEALKQFNATMDGVILSQEDIEILPALPYLTVKVETNEKGEQVYRTRGPNIGEKIIKHMEKRHKKNQSPQPSSVSTLQDLNVEIRMSNKQVRKAAEIEKMVREESIVLDQKDTQLLQRYKLRNNELEKIQTEMHHQAARLSIEFEQEL